MATERPIDPSVTPIPATPGAGGIVLDYYRFLVDDIGGLILRGEVVNTTPFAVLTPRLEFRLLDGDGREIEVVEGPPLPAANLIPAGGRMPISGYVTSERDEWAREEIRLVPGRPATERDRFCLAADLHVEGVKDAVDDRADEFVVRGVVVNDGPAAVQARAHVVFFDAGGRYVAHGGGTSDIGPPIPAGGRGRFEIAFPESVVQAGWTFRVMVTGLVD